MYIKTRDQIIGQDDDHGIDHQQEQAKSKYRNRNG